MNTAATTLHGPRLQETSDLHQDVQDGLTDDEAKRRLSEIGPNELLSTHRTRTVVQILLLFANPLVIILLIASLASALLGEVINAAIIVVMVLMSIALNFFQTFRSERAAERLREQVAPAALVRRDGGWVEIPRRQVVPGDVVRLLAGDLVPADAVLLEARDLHVNEAALTGESLPVEKHAGNTKAKEEGTGEDGHRVFLGTSVVSGSATAAVTATGLATHFGDIARRLATRPPETDFERGTRQFGILIRKTVFFLVVFVFLVSAALKHDAFESLLFAIALAVGLTPEFLPMITTVTLGQGAVHMARQKVIVKHLAAIQNFGSMDVLCSDKTGTLTSGEMALAEHLDPFGDAAERVFLLAYLNSFYETGIENALDVAILRKAEANPLDLAILRHDCPDIKPYRKLDEIPFDFERRRQSVVLETGGERLMITKGAPESVTAICSSYERNGQTYPLTAEARTCCEATFERLSREGFRMLAVAYRRVPPAAYHLSDEREMTLAGYVTFSDPPLEDAPEVLDALRRDGVQVKILTGDNELVARHVCSQVGLATERIVLGGELDHMTDTALAQVAEQTTVFARVSPAQKNRIILALKKRSHVVGFLGDGIDDAPSLHAADVGISVANAVDVAKDTE
jgi:P-type Mg2+ transporter